MGWLKRKLFGVFASRYLKSIVRYLIAALIGILVSNSDIQVPIIQPLIDFLFPQLIAFLQENQVQLAELVAAILTGVLGSWTILKNKTNAKLERQMGVKIK